MTKSVFQIWSHLLKKSLMEHFIFCAVLPVSNNGRPTLQKVLFSYPSIFHSPTVQFHHPLQPRNAYLWTWNLEFNSMSKLTKLKSCNSIIPLTCSHFRVVFLISCKIFSVTKRTFSHSFSFAVEWLYFKVEVWHFKLEVAV